MNRSGWVLRAGFIGVLVIAAALLSGCDTVGKLEEAGDVGALVEIAEKPGQDYTKVTDAVDAIGRIGGDEAVEALAGWVAGDDESMRTAAIPALGATGDPAAVAPLVAEIAELDLAKVNEYHQTDPVVLDLRALVIALGGIDDPAAASALLAQLDAGNSGLVGETQLGRALAGQGEDIIPQLTKRIATKGSDSYIPCGVALFVLNSEDEAAVSKMLHAKNTQRVWAGVFSEGAEYGYKDDLCFALDKFGDVALATRMVNTEDEQMEKAARDWAAKHGYTVEEIMKFGTEQ